MPSPPIDTRTYADFVAETERALAQRVSGWRREATGESEAGSTLIRIFARFCELVVERLNQAPERNELAFLNLIGITPRPPRPARAPLTFTLASGSPVDALVPARTLVGAPPRPGDKDDVVFETERDLVVTRAVLRRVVVSDTETDTYTDRTAEATGQVDLPFPAFAGDRVTPHHLYLGLAPAPGPHDVVIELSSPESWPWLSWPIVWEYWDGQGWARATSSPRWESGSWRVTLAQLPTLVPHSIDEVEAGWVRARLELPLPPAEAGNLPDAVAVGARNPQDLVRGLTVFDDSAQRFFYLRADETFGAAGARARLRLRLTTPGIGRDVRLTWSYQADKDWITLGQSSTGADNVDDSAFALRDETRAFTRDGEVTFQIPANWPRTLYRTRRGRWLRVEMSSDRSYRTPPQIAAIEAGHEWVLPQLSAIAVAGMTLVAARAYNDFTYDSRTETPFAPTADSEPALYLGLDRPFDLRPIVIYVQVEPPRPEEVAADELAELDPGELAVITWEYDGPAGWRSLEATDETQGFSSSGLISFAAPKDLVERSRFGHRGHWLRARWLRGTFPLPPRLRRVRLNTMWATQAVTVVEEILGSSNGNPSQVFGTAQTPVLEDQELLVRERAEPEVWERWDAQPDLYDSGPRDRHYTLDAQTGQIRFGDGSNGLIPPPGPNNVRLTYRTGGGEQGNREAGVIAELKSAIPYVDGATNHEPAQGGAAAEPIERLRARGPRMLRHRDRAVTAQDVQDLSAAASPNVARAAAVAPTFNPYSLPLAPQAAPTADHVKADAGRMGVIVVPQTDSDRPTPSVGLLREVRAHLQARVPATADLWIAGPEWIAVRVEATVTPRSALEADTVGGRVRGAIEHFLHPLTGGPEGRGWEFGRKPHRSDLFALVMAVDGVDTVRELTVILEPDTSDPDRKSALARMLSRPLTEQGDQTEIERNLQRWIDRALVYSGRHEIRVAP